MSSLCVKNPWDGIVGWLTVQVKRNNTDEWVQVGSHAPVHNVFTNAGRDFAHNQVYSNGSAGTRGAGFVGVSADSGSVAAGDTTLTGEIASGGLARADSDAHTHSNGTNTSLVEKTFTASATHTAVHKAAIFNASSSGTMVHAAVFSSDVTLASGDQLKVSFTLTLG